VNDYFKELHSLILKVGLQESNEDKITRFVSSIMEDIQDQVMLYEYSTLKICTTYPKIWNSIKKKRWGQGGATHPTNIIVTHGREKIKINMIHPHPSLTKNHQL